MRENDGFSTIAATLIAGLFMFALILLAPGLAFADDASLRSKPRLAAPMDLRPYLDDADEVATLDAVHTALSQVADGSAYVWHRGNGRISAVMQPTRSFKSAVGQVCRQFSVMLMAGQHSRKTEGIACRLPGGRWQLEG